MAVVIDTEQSFDNIKAPVITCPYCQTGYVSVGTPVVHPGHDRGDAGSVGDMPVRGDILIVPFECEGLGHKWELSLGYHKGQTFISMA